MHAPGTSTGTRGCVTEQRGRGRRQTRPASWVPLHSGRRGVCGTGDRVIANDRPPRRARMRRGGLALGQVIMALRRKAKRAPRNSATASRPASALAQCSASQATTEETLACSGAEQSRSRTGGFSTRARQYVHAADTLSLSLTSTPRNARSWKGGWRFRSCHSVERCSRRYSPAAVRKAAALPARSPITARGRGARSSTVRRRMWRGAQRA